MLKAVIASVDIWDDRQLRVLGSQTCFAAAASLCGSAIITSTSFGRRHLLISPPSLEFAALLHLVPFCLEDIQGALHAVPEYHVTIKEAS